MHFIFGVKLGDRFEVALGPGVINQPGSVAVGIGAEAGANISELLASAERWRPTLEMLRCGAPRSIWNRSHLATTIVQRSLFFHF